jgi:iron complex transport system substrate-binding protein
MSKKILVKLLPLFLVIAALAGIVAACTKSTTTTQPTTSPPTSSPTTPATAQTLTVTDQTGVAVTIPANVTRVVSVYPMSTLIIYSLGGQDKLVGIDSNSPTNSVLKAANPDIGNITQVGMPWQVNLETVVGTKPDVVIGASGDIRTSLEGLGIPVIGVNLESPDKLKEGIKLIGTCIGMSAEADQLIAYYDQKMSVITNRTKDIPEASRIRVLIPNKTGALSCTGGDSYQNFLIEGAGGVNVAKEVTGQWPQVSLEQIITWNPQVIIVPPYCKDTPESILGNSAWQSIDAVKNRRVYLMPQYTVAWDTPVADSILGELWIAKQLYPDKFADLNINTEADTFYTSYYDIHYVWQKTITDSTGENVTIPSYVASIATMREGITEVVCALGMKAKIAAVEDGVKYDGGYGAFIDSIYPDLMDLPCPILGRDPNLEEMLKINPDVILIGGMGRMKWVDPLKSTGLPVVVSHFETLENYMNDIRIVAQVVGAEAKAEELITYLQSKLDFVASRVSDIPEANKVKALFVSHDVYHVYTPDTFEDTQIRAAGGTDVAEGLTGWLPEVSPEQLLAWNPDVIITINDTPIDDILNDAKIANVAAIKNKRVYAIPEAGWDFASPRCLFCIEWMATKFYPDLFNDIDITGEADAFYQTVFGVNYGGPALAETRIITDMAGRTVVIPTDLTRVASVFPYVTQISLALKKGDMLVAVDSASAANANLARVYPGIGGIPAVGSAFNVNKEALLLTDPQLVLTVTWDTNPDKTQSILGVPVVCVDLDYYKEGIEFLGRVLRAQGQAKVFTSYYDEKMAYINGKLAAIPEGDRQKVYVAAGNGAASTYGAESTWHFEVTDAGGINVAADLIGGGAKDVSMEQIIIWNPDVIIVDKSCPDSVAKILADPQWQSINAVKNKRVYRAPDGFLDTFGRPHLESLLSRIWVADKLYGDKMGFDVVAEAKAFYLEFYGISFTDDEINAILNPTQ